jgi:hypothetical protein
LNEELGCTLLNLEDVEQLLAEVQARLDAR